MKFLHLSDLHIGKRIHGYSMLEDQRWILQQILEIVERYQPDGVLIAGDIYDKNVPIESGVTLFNQFLNSLHEMKKQVFFISGNHDSAQRIQLETRFLQNRKFMLQERLKEKSGKLRQKINMENFLSI